jgi:DNA invertase Pin-like site-specific DNA recombinase
LTHPRYVELVRVSSRGQAERDTPADQRADLDRLRKSRPGTFVERIEQQVSGAAAGEDRPDLARLAELAALRAFDEVRVRHLDRLTRHEDPLERAAVLSMVRRAGAVIVDAGGAVLDPKTMGGELTWVVSTLASAEERRKILERTMAAKRRLAAEGRLVSSFAPWGRRWERDEGWTLTAEAKGYRRLFEHVIAGRTLWEIAHRLEAEGVASPKGRPWTGGMVYNLARAPHACGRWKSHGAEVEIPAVVTEATQRAALATLRSHDHAGGNHVRYPALLRKILSCGVCGAPCHTNRNHGGEVYYHCSARDRSHYRAHNVAAVDDAVRARLAAWARRPGAIEAATGEDSRGDAEAAQRDLAAAERDLRKLDGEEERIGRLGVRGGLSEKTAAKLLREVASRRKAADEQAAHARARVEAVGRRGEVAASVEARVSELRARIDRFSHDDWRALVELLFPREGGYTVAIWPDGKIRLNGALPLDAAGEEAVRKARGNPSPRSRMSWSVPVSLDALVPLRRVRS